jgi:hypothetical protein
MFVRVFVNIYYSLRKRQKKLIQVLQQARHCFAHNWGTGREDKNVTTRQRENFNNHLGRHDIQHNDTQHKDIQHNETQHKDIHHNLHSAK